MNLRYSDHLLKSLFFIISKLYEYNYAVSVSNKHRLGKICVKLLLGYTITNYLLTDVLCLDYTGAWTSE